MWDYVQILATFFVSPRKATSATLDHGRLGAVAMIALATAAGLYLAQNVLEGIQQTNAMVRASKDPELQAQAEEARKDPEQAAAYARALRAYTLQEASRAMPVNAFSELLLVAVIFVPLGIGITSAWEGRGAIRAIRQEFGSVVMCVALAWAAARLVAIPFVISPQAFQWAYLASSVLFLIFAAGAFQTTLGARWLPASASAVVGAGVVAAASMSGFGVSPALYMMGSPWLLYYFWGSISSGASSIGSGVSARQSFQRALQATTLNPRDADAHAQLGHIQMQRRNWKEAETRFRTAATIDPEDAEYAFHLGCALREQGNEAEAKTWLARAAAVNDKTSSSEVLRELGAAQMATGELPASLASLTRYVDRREYDPIGLVYLGESLEHAKDRAQARQMFERAVEAVKTMPSHRRGELRRWGSRAQSGIRRVS